jgi:hypothetical protein
MQQPPQLYITATFTSKSSGRTNAIEISVIIKLEQITGVENRTAFFAGFGFCKTQCFKIQVAYK